MSKETIYGTGLNGLIGSRICELTANKYDWVNLDLRTGVDITNLSTVEAVVDHMKGDVLLHLAAFTNVDEAWNQRENKRGLCYRVNVEGTRNIARVCKETGKHLIHVSTEFVFSGNKNDPYTEKDIPDPIDWYGKTKYWAEQEVENSGCSYTIIRPSFPFRAHFSEKKDNVRRILEGLQKKSLFSMFTDAVITPTFIDDLGRVIEVMAQIKPDGIFHTVGSSFLSPFELAQKIATVFDIDNTNIQRGSLTEYTKEGERPYLRHLAVSNRKLKKKLKIGMKTIDEALQEMKRQQEALS